jgi:hypothetical protein
MHVLLLSLIAISWMAWPYCNLVLLCLRFSCIQPKSWESTTSFVILLQHLCFSFYILFKMLYRWRWNRPNWPVQASGHRSVRGLAVGELFWGKGRYRVMCKTFIGRYPWDTFPVEGKGWSKIGREGKWKTMQSWEVSAYPTGSLWCKDTGP